MHTLIVALAVTLSFALLAPPAYFAHELVVATRAPTPPSMFPRPRSMRELVGNVELPQSFDPADIVYAHGAPNERERSYYAPNDYGRAVGLAFELDHRVGDCSKKENGIGTIPLCSPGCGDTPPARNWIRADQIDQSRLGPGVQYNVNLRQVQPRDNEGRYAHVVGIRITGTYRFTLGATNAAFSGYQQLAAITNLFLQDASGWQYWAGNIDGRVTYDDRWMRSLSLSAFDSPPANIAANAGAGNVDHVISMYSPLTRPYARGHEAMVGSIPLAALQANGDQAFSFYASGALPGGPAGITPAGFIGTTEVWLEIAWLDSLFLDRPWQLETYVDANTAGTAKHCDRTHEYFAVYFFPEDNGGQYINDFGVSTFQVAGQTIQSGYTLAQWVERTLFTVNDDPRNVDTSPSLVSAGNVRIGFIVGPTIKGRGGMAAGPIGYDFATRTRTQTRFIHRTWGAHADERLAKLCDPNAAVVGLMDNGGVRRGKAQKLDSLIVTAVPQTAPAKQ